MRLLRWISAAAIVAMTVALHSTEAFGIDDRGGTGVDPSTDTISAGVQFGRPPSGKGGADSSGCTWIPGGEAATFDSSVADQKLINGKPYRLFLKICPTYNNGIWVPEASNVNLGVNAVAKVKEQLAKPSIGSAPGTDQGIVNVGMWLWTDPAEYTAHSITAWVPTLTGIAWSTTSARPVRLVYSSGEPDGQPLVCQGPGRKWEPGFGDELASDCMYTYRHSSEITASDTFVARLSIVWSITSTSNVGPGANIGEYTTSTDQAITIKEIQAVITN